MNNKPVKSKKSVKKNAKSSNKSNKLRLAIKGLV